MPGLVDAAIALIEKGIVLSPYGKLLGMELVDAGEDRVAVRLPFRGDLVTYGDTVHGGAIAALIDVAATASFWATPTASPGSRGATVGFSVNFTSAARGSDLVATATLRRRGREISIGEVSVRDTAGKEVAVALVTYKLSPAAG